MKPIALALALICPTVLTAQSANPVVTDIVEGHILPGFESLAANAQTLADTAAADCAPTSPDLRGAYGAAFDAWVSVSHLRFGPTEVDDRAFALAFWPDSRGTTPRSLGSLIAQQDPIANDPAAYAEVSIAARGFYALEFLLFDEALMNAGDAAYRCTLIQTVTADIALTTQDIVDAWQTDYAETLLNPAPDGYYRSDLDALQELFKALSTGLQFTSDTRLGRPLGTFDRPRPTRAEARRSGRSAAHVMLSLIALQDLAGRLAADDPAMAEDLDAAFTQARDRLADLDDPVFAGVAQPLTRIRVEAVQQNVDAIRAIVGNDLGPTLGVAAGFNSLDGD
ncbi:imelysin family protein [Yoonia sp. BS5-3]|uniref:Imelysin family protein n=1 Tax=Yoonia phaeophyticola TaxID=3137369 RepID=A0ABZ2V4H9_9RHOB